MKEFLIRVYIAKDFRVNANSKQEALEKFDENYILSHVLKVRIHEIKNVLKGKYLENFFKKIRG